jgi:hypothetical protein
MHHVDWFVDEHSLEEFIKAVQPGVSFLFSAYNRVADATGKVEVIINRASQVAAIVEEPLRLFSGNIIGHPSTTMIKNERAEWYDSQLSWVVDFEFYIRCLREDKNIAFIDWPLVNIGMNASQLTKQLFGKREIELFENLYLLKKFGAGILKNIRVYDYYWRSFRNLGIRSIADVAPYKKGLPMPPALTSMLNFQRRLPLKLLRFGPASKIGMGLSFLFPNKKG